MEVMYGPKIKVTKILNPSKLLTHSESYQKNADNNLQVKNKSNSFRTASD